MQTVGWLATQKRCWAWTRFLPVLVAGLLSAGLQARAGRNELNGADYNLHLMSPDLQTIMGTPLCNHGYSYALDAYDNLYDIFLAKHEKEAVQLFFYAFADGPARDLRLEIDAFADATGNHLPHTVYNEEFFSVANVSTNRFAEALVPYDGRTVRVEPGQNAVFYIEVESAPDQPPGRYESAFSLYDGDTLLSSAPISATVWNFALPESHYATTTMGLYNESSSYRNTRGFLEKSGIRFLSPDQIHPDDLPEAKRILAGWHEFLLDHGVTPYELPRFLIDDDPKAAELAMADPRRKSVSIPFRSGRDLFLRYRDLVCSNAYLADKAYFYVDDELKRGLEADAATIADISTDWPSPHCVVPLASAPSNVLTSIRSMTDILCLNQVTLPGDSYCYDFFTSNRWHRTWRYPGQTQHGWTAVVMWGKNVMGAAVRVFYWQMEPLGSDGILNWNAAFLPYVESSTVSNGVTATQTVPYDIWGSREIYPKHAPAGVNGEGIFLYESKSLGLNPATPIASLRLKHFNNGMDDHDYLRLAREAFGTAPDSPYGQALGTWFQYYLSKGPKYIFSCEKSSWPDGGNYEWSAHAGGYAMRARLLLGEALSQAGGVSHSYGEWQTVVGPDATHPGLRVRQCRNCGTYESQPIPPLQVPPRLAPGNVSLADGGIALDAFILSNRWAYAVCTNLVALPVLWTQISASVDGIGAADAITIPFPDSPAIFIRLEPVDAE